MSRRIRFISAAISADVDVAVDVDVAACAEYVSCISRTAARVS
eukprot:CAMPEP_0171305224 /NCGR_PEP_ID=MMETSP0816-20121228/15024_1 /TAXON_ID=420281 /ORGANISM="Proboscia inermis, Strain CCAP1064/1" /LENGTH=42 /DNA_ID= /DNA_START= /DNA_END= /DNA_ORIENTATION=